MLEWKSEPGSTEGEWALIEWAGFETQHLLYFSHAMLDKLIKVSSQFILLMIFDVWDFLA